MAQQRIVPHRTRPAAAVRGHRQFFRAVADKLGEPPTAELETQVRVVLGLLGARLPAADAKAVATRLPAELARALTSGAPGPSDLTSLRRQLEDRGVSERVCRATCQALAEAVGEQGRAHLRVQPLGAMFAS